MFLMADCHKLGFSKENTATLSISQLPQMSAFTISLCNGDFMIVFCNIHSVIAALVFVIVIVL